MIFSEGKGVNPLFSPLNPSDPILSQLFRLVGKPIASLSERTMPSEFLQKTKLESQTSSFRSEKVTGSRNQTLKGMQEGVHPNANPKPKEISRWEAFTQHATQGPEPQSSDKTTIGTIWNYFLGETKASDCFTYHTHKRKENLTMVVEPNQKGFALYVFWKAEGFGPYGIIFYYEPEKQNPIRIEILSDGVGTIPSFPSRPSLKQMLQDLIRDFPQIGEIHFEVWNDTNFNGDYR